MNNKYYLCVDFEKNKEHRPLVEPSDKNIYASCSCGAWYIEVTKEEYEQRKGENIE